MAYISKEAGKAVDAYSGIFSLDNQEIPAIPPEQTLDCPSHNESNLSTDDSRLQKYLQSEDCACLSEFVQKMKYSYDSFTEAIRNLLTDNVQINHDNVLNYLLEKEKPSTLDSKDVLAPCASPRTNSMPYLRPIVIGGDNVAMEHGDGKVYSCRGIGIVVKWFQDKGHTHITVFIPAYKMKSGQKKIIDQYILKELKQNGVLVKTPSGQTKKMANYDDRIILTLAAENNAIVVSNKHFRDLAKDPKYSDTIENRLLPFTFVGDRFIPADDPLGKKGPSLDLFLRIDPMVTSGGICPYAGTVRQICRTVRPCPYGRKCTSGLKCKYRHPEKEHQLDTAISSSNAPPFIDSGLSSIRKEIKKPMEQTAGRQYFNMNQPQGLQSSSFSYSHLNYPPQYSQSSHLQRPSSMPVLQRNMQPDYQPAAQTGYYQSRFYSLPGEQLPDNSIDPYLMYHSLGHPPYHRSPGASASRASYPMNHFDSNWSLSDKSDYMSSIPQNSEEKLDSLPWSEASLQTFETLSINSTDSLNSTGSSRRLTSPSHDRSHIYQCLTEVFNSNVVKKVMEKYPQETSKEVLFEKVMKEVSRKI